MAQGSEPDRPEDAKTKEQPEEERESIWTIPIKYKGWYFGLFSVQIIIAAIWLIRTAIVDESRNSIPEILLFIWQAMAPVAITSATFALVIIDTWKTAMVFGTWLEETLEKRKQRQIKAAVEAAVKPAVEAAVEKTRAEEREATRQLLRNWQNWNSRREAALAAGKEFNEPPPVTDDPDNDNPQPE